MSIVGIKPDLALVGAGYWGKNLARNFRALGALHTICDAHPGILDGYKEDYLGVKKTNVLEDVLNDSAITKVAIAAPAILHYQIVKDALLSGKDVYVEKPLCLEEDQARELVDLADKERRVLMVGHLLQYHPCIIKLQSLVAQGELGKLNYITSNRLNLGKIRKEENALWSFAPHDISVILSLAGHQLPEQVHCFGGSYLSEQVADTTLTTLKFAGGLRAHVYVSWLNPFKEQKLTVVGSKGMAVFDDTRSWDEKLILHRDYLTWTNGNTPTPSKAPGERVQVAESEPLKNECQHFLDCCRERHTPRTDGREGLRVLEVLQMAQKNLEADGSNGDSNGESVAAAPSNRPPVTSSTYFTHPTAIVDDGAQIGKGSKIWHFSHVMSGADIGERCSLGQNVNVDKGTVIGNNVKIQNNVSIYAGVSIEDDVFLGPSCVFTNVSNPRSQVNRQSLYEKTLIKRGATVGANATILCGITIHRYAFIGAGSVVTRDVAEYSLVFGNPARHHGWMSRHGHPLVKFGPDQISICPESGYRYQEIEPGKLKCLDLDENSPLPSTLSTGVESYKVLKRKFNSPHRHEGESAS